MSLKAKEEIRIRDPFILADRATKKYYMYGTTELTDGIGTRNKFSAYVSCDLKYFDGPYVVFDGSTSGFFATQDFWAAEVWLYKDKYYLFGSCCTTPKNRLTQIFIGDNPLGPFSPLPKARTPESWTCLDGTLYVENDIPYMVFCREWCEVEDGLICAVQLKDDLTDVVGEPFVLFAASENVYVDSFKDKHGENCRITDGPFLFRERGKLKMIWSSISHGKYAVLEAISDTIMGKWQHLDSRFDFDGGHAMIFKAFDGKKYMALHSPNTPPLERPIFIEYSER